MIARALAQEGANVAVHYLKSAESAAEIVKEVKKAGVDSFALQADLSDLQQVKVLAEKVWKKWGRCDVLVNNAGETAATQMSWRELSPEVVDGTLSLDVKGTLFCTHEFGKRMLDEQRSGSICPREHPTGGVQQHDRTSQKARERFGQRSDMRIVDDGA